MQGKDLPAYLELDYWNVSALETLRALVQTLPAAQDAPVSICGSDHWSHEGLIAALALLPEADQARFRLIGAGSPGAAYTLANRTYTVLGHWQPTANQTAVVETRSFGQIICTVYQHKVN